MKIWVIMLLAVFAAGCSNNKGKYNGKVNVVVSEQLKAMGVSLVDWRYTESAKAFGIKLNTSKPVDKRLYISISGPRIGDLRSPGPVATTLTKRNGWTTVGASASGIPSRTSRKAGPSPLITMTT